jgi:hypothetical protein
MTRFRSIKYLTAYEKSVNRTVPRQLLAVRAIQGVMRKALLRRRTNALVATRPLTHIMCSNTHVFHRGIRQMVSDYL